MSNCRICQNSLPRDQTFCSHCGTRQAALTAIGNVRRNPFSRLKNFFSEAFQSEAEKRFDDACQLAIGGFNAAIPRLEGFEIFAQPSCVSSVGSEVPRVASFRMEISIDTSATSLFRRVFSLSSSLSFLAWSILIPPYSLRQR